MATVDQVLATARAEIGTRQAANGSNKYGKAYGMDRVAWCAEFVWWALTTAGAGAQVPKTAYTPTMYQWYAARGQAGKTPRKGAIVFFNWPGDGVNRIQHVGIVEAVNSDGSITTIEGNTSSGTAGSQGNGGGVWRRRRAGSSIVGYGYPAYSGAAAPAAPAPAAPSFDPNSMASLKYGMRNDDRVKALQRFLNAYPWKPELPLLEPLGNYLDQTASVLRAAGKQVGVDAGDGRDVGPRFKAAFAARGARW